MREIPEAYIRANQVGVVFSVVLAMVLQLPVIVLVLWAVQTAGLLTGGKANVFVLAAKPFIRRWVNPKHTQSEELARFNNSLSVLFSTLAVVCFYLFQWNTAGYIIAGIHGAAAFVAVCGFCVGCFVYFHYKQLKHRMSKG
ncbi:DUF4395 domain-containing protein [Paenibacillus alkalitolerans]|uniref:DUF4395 domain-containing protein n=1 Tax=Paenibacillus alkalitolerans TaxID=2799335 RepID=UPI0018F2CF6A|nr:DUF4395 domain-containing protein [Paenibacillus alkalitolerans]